MRRRRVLGGLIALAASGAALRPKSASRAQLPPARTYRVRVPGIAIDLPVARPSLSIGQVYQGGAVRVSTNPAFSGTATFRGRVHTLQPGGMGLQGFVAIGTEDPAGAATITVRLLMADGEASAAVPVTVLKTAWTVDRLTIPPPQPGDPDPLDPGSIRAEADRIFALYAGVSPPRWSDPWLSPLTGTQPVSGYFGEQRSINGGPVGGHHGGTDFGVVFGTPVYATNAGLVVLAERLIVRGNMVILDHGGGVLSGYAHLSEIAVAAGQTVAKGQRIGAVGVTGLVTGAHLHWELAAGGILVDGLRWLDGTQGF